MASILVVEDNPDNLKLVELLLRPLRAEIVAVKDGPSGIEAASQRAFDIILLDIQLPGMDGHQVAGALRAMPMCAQTPILAVTSHAMPGDREAALKAGCSGYMEKPLDPATFASEVAKHLWDGERGP